MIVVIFLMILAILNGVLLTYLVIEQCPLVIRFCAGSVIGLALLAWIGYLVSLLLLALNIQSILITCFIFIILLFFLIRKIKPFNKKIVINTKVSVIIYTIVWVILFSSLYSHVIRFTPDGLFTGPYGNWFDISFHLSSITSFAYGENFPTENPFYAGQPFRYPFLSDFLTALFIVAGASWPMAFFVQNIILSLSLIGLIYFLTFSLTKNSLASYLAPILFFLYGGLGFIQFFYDLSSTKSTWLYFFSHLNTYTQHNYLFFLGNKTLLAWVNGMQWIIPQRSLLFGFPFVTMIIILWWRSVDEPEAIKRRNYFIAAGILTGLLPLLHTHGFLAIMIASVQLIIFFFSWEWIFFLIPILFLGGPQVFYLHSNSVKGYFFAEFLWWKSVNSTSPVLFFLVNIGLYIILLLIMLLNKRLCNSHLFKFYVPFSLWFIIPSLVLLSPKPWDNLKFFLYWSLISSSFIAYLLANLWQRRLVFQKVLAIILGITLIFSGVLDSIVRALSPIENYKIFDSTQLEVANKIRKITSPKARILSSPIPFSLLYLTGRRLLMGDPSIVKSHGKPEGYDERIIDLPKIFLGGNEAVQLLEKYKIDYLVINSSENEKMYINESFFDIYYHTVIKQGNYRVFKIKK